MQSIYELKAPPVVGQEYLVYTRKPASLEDRENPYQWVSLLGPPHQDLDIEGGEVEHSHEDFRFMTPARFDYYSKIVQARGLFTLGIGTRNTEYLPAELIPRVCYRRFAPLIHPDREMFAAFEGAYIGKRWQGDCKNCPHHGFPLAQTLAFGSQKTRVCPVHGLMVNREGEVVRRYGAR